MTISIPRRDSHQWSGALALRARTRSLSLVLVQMFLLALSCSLGLPGPASVQGYAPSIPATYTAQFDEPPRHSGWRAGGTGGTGVAWFGDTTSWTSFTGTTAAQASAVTYSTQTLDFTSNGGDNSAGAWPTSGVSIGSANSRFTLSIWFSLGPVAASAPGSFPSFTALTQQIGNLLHIGPYIHPDQPTARYLMAYWSGSYYMAAVPQWTVGQWYHLALIEHSSSLMTFYLNGQALAMTAQSGSYKGNNGVASWLWSGQADGGLAQVQLWYQVTLAPDNIVYLANNPPAALRGIAPLLTDFPSTMHYCAAPVMVTVAAPFDMASMYGVSNVSLRVTSSIGAIITGSPVVLNAANGWVGRFGVAPDPQSFVRDFRVSFLSSAPTLMGSPAPLTVSMRTGAAVLAQAAPHSTFTPSTSLWSSSTPSGVSGAGIVVFSSVWQTLSWHSSNTFGSDADASFPTTWGGSNGYAFEWWARFGSLSSTEVQLFYNSVIFSAQGRLIITVNPQSSLVQVYSYATSATTGMQSNPYGWKLSPPIVANAWLHIVVSSDAGGAVSVFCNGVPATFTYDRTTHHSWPIVVPQYMSRPLAFTGNWASGALARIGFWLQPLSAAAVLALYGSMPVSLRAPALTNLALNTHKQSALVENAVTLSPRFQAGSTRDSFNVSYPYADVTGVTLTTTFSSGTVLMERGCNGATPAESVTLVSGAPSRLISLSQGTAPISTLIRVHSSLDQTYSLFATRTGQDLIDLQLSAFAGTMARGVVVTSPAEFSSSTFAYTATLPYTLTAITVTALFQTPGSVVLSVPGIFSQALQSTVASTRINLRPPPASTTLVVTSTKVGEFTYELVPLNDVSGFGLQATTATGSTTSFAFNPVFAPGTFEYAVTMPFIFPRFHFSVSYTTATSCSFAWNGGANVACMASGTLTSAPTLPSASSGASATATLRVDSTRDGSYSLSITRAAPDLTALSALGSSSGSAASLSLSPAFSVGHGGPYALALPYADSSVRLSAQFGASGSVSLSVGGSASVQLTSGVASAPIALAAGATLSIAVLSTRDGAYTISVTRAAPDLTALSVERASSGAGTGTGAGAGAAPLSPAFVAGQGGPYSVSVPYAVAAVRLSALFGTGGSVTYSVGGGASVQLTSSVASAPIALAAGATLSVAVLSTRDGAYTISVARALPDVSALSVVGSGELGSAPLSLSPAFVAGQGGPYAVALPYAISAVRLSAQFGTGGSVAYSVGGGASVQLASGVASASLAVAGGASLSLSVVSSADGAYAISVTRAVQDVFGFGASCRSVSGAAAQPFSFSPAFDAGQLSYSLRVPAQYDSCALTVSYATPASVTLRQASSAYDSAAPSSGVSTPQVFALRVAQDNPVTALSQRDGLYTLSMERGAWSVTDLKLVDGSAAALAAALSPPFVPGVLAGYSATVPFFTPAIGVQATFHHADTVIVVFNGVPSHTVTSGVPTGSDSFSLVGGQTATLQLLSADDSAISIAVTRLPPDITSIALQFSDKSGVVLTAQASAAVAMTPAKFVPGVYDYALVVPFIAQKVSVGSIFTVPDSVLLQHGNSGSEAGPIPLASGIASAPLSLSSSDLLTVLSSQDGNYTFTIVRSPASLTGLDATGWAGPGSSGSGSTFSRALSLSFSPTTDAYSIEVPYVLASVSFTAHFGGVDGNKNNSNNNTIFLFEPASTMSAGTPLLPGAPSSPLLSMTPLKPRVFSIVSAYDGVYNVSVTRAAQQLTSLALLGLSSAGGAPEPLVLDASFTAHRFSYSASNVPVSMENFTIVLEMSPSATAPTLVYNDVAYEYSPALRLPIVASPPSASMVYPNLLTIVSESDGNYTVSLRRHTQDLTDVQLFALSSGSIFAAPLVFFPAVFDVATRVYAATVSHLVVSVRLQADYGTAGTVSVRLNGAALAAPDSGRRGDPLPLVLGRNTLVVSSTADGVSYTFVLDQLSNICTVSGSPCKNGGSCVVSEVADVATGLLGIDYACKCVGAFTGRNCTYLLPSGLAPTAVLEPVARIEASSAPLVGACATARLDARSSFGFGADVFSRYFRWTLLQVLINNSVLVTPSGPTDISLALHLPFDTAPSALPAMIASGGVGPLAVRNALGSSFGAWGLGSFDHSVLELPSSILCAPCVYTLGLVVGTSTSVSKQLRWNVTTALPGSASGSIASETPLWLPSLSIFSLPMLDRTVPSVFRSRVLPNPCMGLPQDAQLVYSWNVTLHSTSLAPAVLAAAKSGVRAFTSSDAALTVPAHWFLPGSTYRASLRLDIVTGMGGGVDAGIRRRLLAATSVSSASASTSSTVAVAASPLVCQIVGASWRERGVDTSITADASVSYDPDAGDTSTSATATKSFPFTFSWSVTAQLSDGTGPTTAVSLAPGFGAMLKQSDSILSFAPNLLKAGYTYNMTVRITSTTDGASSSAAVRQSSAWVIVVAHAPKRIPAPIVNINAVPAFVSPSRSLSLYSSVFSASGTPVYDMHYSWRVVAGDTELDLTDARNIASAPNATTLIIRPDRLREGLAYTVQLTVRDPAYPGVLLENRAAANFLVVSRPQGGSCVLTPNAQTINSTDEPALALSTEFLISCLNWFDPSAQHPLSYSFAYWELDSDPSRSRLVNLLTAPQSDSNLRTTLPAGRIQIVVIVSTRMYAETLVTNMDSLFVDVAYPPSAVRAPTCFLSDTTAKALASALRTQDDERALVLITAMAKLLEELYGNASLANTAKPTDTACEGGNDPSALAASQAATHLALLQALQTILNSTDAVHNPSVLLTVSHNLQLLTSHPAMLLQHPPLLSVAQQVLQTTLDAYQGASIAHTLGTSSVNASALNAHLAQSVSNVLVSCDQLDDTGRHIQQLLDIVLTQATSNQIMWTTNTTNLFATATRTDLAAGLRRLTLPNGVEINLTPESLAQFLAALRKDTPGPHSFNFDTAVGNNLDSSFGTRPASAQGTATGGPAASASGGTSAAPSGAANLDLQSKTVVYNSRWRSCRPLDNDTSFGGVLSNLTTIDLTLSNGRPLNFSALTGGVTFILPIPANATAGLVVRTRFVDCDGRVTISERPPSANDTAELVSRLRCEWWDPVQRNFSGSGCVSNGLTADGLGLNCTCGHLTEWAVLFREKSIVHERAEGNCIDEQASTLGKVYYLAFFIAYALLALISATQFVRVFLSSKLRHLLLTLEHFLICLMSLSRGFNMLVYWRLYSLLQLDGPLLQLTSGVPHILTNWVLSILLLAWASIYHYELNHRGSGALGAHDIHEYDAQPQKKPNKQAKGVAHPSEPVAPSAVLTSRTAHRNPFKFKPYFRALMLFNCTYTAIMLAIMAYAAYIAPDAAPLDYSLASVDTTSTSGANSIGSTSGASAPGQSSLGSTGADESYAAGHGFVLGDLASIDANYERMKLMFQTGLYVITSIALLFSVAFVSFAVHQRRKFHAQRDRRLAEEKDERDDKAAQAEREHQQLLASNAHKPELLVALQRAHADALTSLRSPSSGGTNTSFTLVSPTAGLHFFGELGGARTLFVQSMVLGVCFSCASLLLLLTSVFSTSRWLTESNSARAESLSLLYFCLDIFCLATVLLIFKKPVLRTIKWDGMHARIKQRMKQRLAKRDGAGKGGAQQLQQLQQPKGVATFSDVVCQSINNNMRVVVTAPDAATEAAQEPGDAGAIDPDAVSALSPRSGGPLLASDAASDSQGLHSKTHERGDSLDHPSSSSAPPDSLVSPWAKTRKSMDFSNGAGAVAASLLAQACASSSVAGSDSNDDVGSMSAASTGAGSPHRMNSPLPPASVDADASPASPSAEQDPSQRPHRPLHLGVPRRVKHSFEGVSMLSNPAYGGHRRAFSAGNIPLVIETQEDDHHAGSIVMLTSPTGAAAGPARSDGSPPIHSTTLGVTSAAGVLRFHPPRSVVERFGATTSSFSDGPLSPPPSSSSLLLSRGNSGVATPASLTLQRSHSKTRHLVVRSPGAPGVLVTPAAADFTRVQAAQPGATSHASTASAQTSRAHRTQVRIHFPAMRPVPETPHWLGVSAAAQTDAGAVAAEYVPGHPAPAASAAATVAASADVPSAPIETAQSLALDVLSSPEFHMRNLSAEPPAVTDTDQSAAELQERLHQHAIFVAATPPLHTQTLHARTSETLAAAAAAGAGAGASTSATRSFLPGSLLSPISSAPSGPNTASASTWSSVHDAGAAAMGGSPARSIPVRRLGSLTRSGSVVRGAGSGAGAGAVRIVRGDSPSGPSHHFPSPNNPLRTIAKSGTALHSRSRTGSARRTSSVFVFPVAAHTTAATAAHTAGRPTAVREDDDVAPTLQPSHAVVSQSDRLAGGASFPTAPAAAAKSAASTSSTSASSVSSGALATAARPLIHRPATADDSDSGPGDDSDAADVDADSDILPALSMRLPKRKPSKLLASSRARLPNSRPAPAQAAPGRTPLLLRSHSRTTPKATIMRVHSGQSLGSFSASALAAASSSSLPPPMARVVRAPSSTAGGSYSTHPFSAARSPRASTGAGRVLRGLAGHGSSGASPQLTRVRSYARRVPDSPDLAAQARAMYAVHRTAPVQTATSTTAAGASSSTSSALSAHAYGSGTSSSSGSGGSSAATRSRLSAGGSNLAAMGMRAMQR